MLREFKTSPRFTDRNDLEVAADDTVPYDAVVQAIDLAIQQGFTRWSLRTPSTTSVRFRR